MLRLCSLLNQSSSKALSAIFSMVSSTGTLVKSEDTSYDTKMSWPLISIPWSSSTNWKMSLTVCGGVDCFRSTGIFSLFKLLSSLIFCHLYLHIYIFCRISAFVTFLPDFTISIYLCYLFIFLLALENDLGEVETS